MIAHRSPRRHTAIPIQPAGHTLQSETHKLTARSNPPQGRLATSEDDVSDDPNDDDYASDQPSNLELSSRLFFVKLAVC